jgi:hypothetical protein
MVGIFAQMEDMSMYIEEITGQTIIPNLMDDENVCMIKRNYSGKLEIIELATFQISKIKKYMEHKDVAFVIVKDDEKGA